MYEETREPFTDTTGPRTPQGGCLARIKKLPSHLFVAHKPMYMTNTARGTQLLLWYKEKLQLVGHQ